MSESGVRHVLREWRTPTVRAAVVVSGDRGRYASYLSCFIPTRQLVRWPTKERSTMFWRRRSWMTWRT